MLISDLPPPPLPLTLLWVSEQSPDPLPLGPVAKVRSEMGPLRGAGDAERSVSPHTYSSSGDTSGCVVHGRAFILNNVNKGNKSLTVFLPLWECLL